MLRFIGEIKGITSNIKSENVSQLDVHCQSYMDVLDAKKQNETVKGILIISPFRNKSIKKREPVHEKQIQLAIRNKSLIITTEILLKMFMLYLQDKITTEKVIGLLKNKVGIITESDFT